MKYLLDTNQLSAAFRAQPAILKRLREVEARGDRPGTCIAVLCELEAGIQQMARVEENRRLLRMITSRLTLWPLEVETARLFGEVYRELKSKGRKLSHVDMTLAALARQLKASIITADRDYEALPDLKTENWLL